MPSMASRTVVVFILEVTRQPMPLLPNLRYRSFATQSRVQGTLTGFHICTHRNRSPVDTHVLRFWDWSAATRVWGVQYCDRFWRYVRGVHTHRKKKVITNRSCHFEWEMALSWETIRPLFFECRSDCGKTMRSRIFQLFLALSRVTRKTGETVDSGCTAG